MIATGGLLRISRRQDSLRAKNRAENKRKRKARKKMKNNVVVVKGKLNLLSISGLVAAFGVLILMVGVTMAVLGYWPKENSVHSQLLPREKHPVLRGSNKTPLNFTSNNKLWQMQWNSSNATSNATKPDFRPVRYFEGLFSTYLYSDNLKVFGPLVMGIGIFLFICANAVLHENRDKKTKIIDLRDIYSTVIDIHSMRSKSHSPRNGLLSCTESKDGVTAIASRGSWPSTMSNKGSEYRRSSCSRKFSWFRERQSFTETIYSICKDGTGPEKPMPSPKEWETLSIVTSSVNAFTLPVIKLNNHEMEVRVEQEKDKAKCCSLTDKLCPKIQSSDKIFSTAIQTEAEVSREISSVSQDSSLPNESSLLFGTCQQQLLLPNQDFKMLGSHLSLNALSDLSTGHHEERSRRFSCPRLDRLGSKGYIKLASLGGDSFEAPDRAPEAGVEEFEQAGLRTMEPVLKAQKLPCNSLTQLHKESTLSNSHSVVDLDPKTNLCQEEQV